MGQARSPLPLQGALPERGGQLRLRGGQVGALVRVGVHCPYEPSVRVPLLLRWPGRTHAGTTCADPVGLTDVLPTLVAELDLDYPADQGPLPGESMLGAAGGGLASERGDYVIDYGQTERSATQLLALCSTGTPLVCG